MKANIVIFGRSSIIAQNFVNKDFCKKANIISISRSSELEVDICCDIGKLLLPQEVEDISSKIKKKITYKKTFFILFSWYGGPRLVDKSNEVWSTNMNIIQNFINLSELILPSRIVFLSSAGALYPKNIKSYNFPETHIPFPINSYGEQKLLSEKLLTYFSKILNINLTILRISSAFGFDSRFSDQGVINKWLYSALNNQKIKLYNSRESEINFISFEQISKSIFISLEHELNGIYNIGTENSISLGSLIEEIEKTLNKKLIIKEVNFENRFFNIDISKFKSETGEVFKLKLRENIKSIYKSILNQNNKN